MITTKQPTDEDIINYMRESLDVNNWNERRDHVKSLRDRNWIIKHIDSSGLIIKAKIKKNPPKTR